MTIFRRHYNRMLPLLLLSALVCCGASSRSGAVNPDDLPEYTAADAALFDDVAGAAAFGLTPDVPPAEDRNLGARYRQADAVVTGRVSTVTQERLAGKAGYSLAITVEETLRGAIGERVLELRMPAGTRGIARMDASGASLVGRRMLLFVRRFVREGDVELHWHGEPDDAEIRKALRDVKPLDGARAREQTGR